MGTYVMSDFIQGEKFEPLSSNKNIFYCATHNIDKFLQAHPVKMPVLITHNSDNSINFAPPPNVDKWFAQNVNIVSDKIESLPIGLENNRWFPQINKKAQMTAKLQQPKKIKNLAYMNFRLKRAKERPEIYTKLETKPWITKKRGTNGLDFEEYLDNVYNHQFVLSPRGNGIDTHRTWECLYMGTIPIERRNINNQYYTDLPICFVDDWDEITEEFLHKEYDRITTSTWNMDKLKFGYWEKKILTSANKEI